METASSQYASHRLTPWMNRTRWCEIFVDKDMKQLLKATQNPKTEKTELDCLLSLAWSGTKTMIYHCIRSSRDCISRDWMTVLFWLNSNQKLTASQCLFTMNLHDSTLEKYCEIWQQFICFCLRAIEDPNKVNINSKK